MEREWVLGLGYGVSCRRRLQDIGAESEGRLGPGPSPLSLNVRAEALMPTTNKRTKGGEASRRTNGQ